MSMGRISDDGGTLGVIDSGLKIAIIGAGVSGLTACKHFSERGLDSTVFEGKSGVGGVWRNTYPTTCLQNPHFTYAFSDFPWPDSSPLFPSHLQVVDYLEKYTLRFGLTERIRLNCQVVEAKKKFKSEPPVDEQADFVWNIRVRRKIKISTGSVEYVDEWFEFDYLVICCGRFGDVANLPQFPALQGPDVFEGQVLHSMQYSDLDSDRLHELLSGKKVVVVGSRKTALDIACEVANTNQLGLNEGKPCTMLFRRANWMFSNKSLVFGPFKFTSIFSTRLSEYWTPKPGQGLMQRVLQNIFEPVRFTVWKMWEYYFRRTIPVERYGLLPDHSLFHGLIGGLLAQLPDSLLGHLEGGRIVPKKASSWSFYPKGVRLADGTDVEADVVIFCTGYDGESKLKAVIPEEYQRVLFEPEGLLTLYRGIIHPQIPKMGFLGYFEGLSSVYSSEMGAQWLANLLLRKFSLPDVATMETDRRNWLEFMKIATPFYEKPYITARQIWHTDKLCRDIGTKVFRKKTWWEETFSYYGSSDYKSL